jgi:hypothetical protein
LFETRGTAIYLRALTTWTTYALRARAEHCEVPRAELVNKALVEFSAFDSARADPMVRLYAAVSSLHIQLPLDPVDWVVQIDPFLSYAFHHLTEESGLDAVRLLLRAFLGVNPPLRLTPDQYQVVMAEDARARNHAGDGARGSRIDRVKGPHQAVLPSVAEVPQMHVPASRIMGGHVAMKSLEEARLY